MISDSLTFIFPQLVLELEDGKKLSRPFQPKTILAFLNFLTSSALYVHGVQERGMNCKWSARKFIWALGAIEKQLCGKTNRIFAK